MIDETYYELYIDLCTIRGMDANKEFCNIVHAEHPELTKMDIQDVLNTVIDRTSEKRNSMSGDWG